MMTKDNGGEKEFTEDDDGGPVIVSSPRDKSRTKRCLQKPEITNIPAVVGLGRLWKSCYAYGVLWITMVATGCTFVVSWDCDTFYSGNISAQGVGDGGFGIWSLQDSAQQCQLWGVLFASHHLDTPLRMARFFSMTAMLASLVAIAILSQVLPRGGGVASCIVTLGSLIYWLTDSILSSGWRFNVWSSFFILTYTWMILFTKCVLSQMYPLEALWNWANNLMLICCVGSIGIFVILESNICVCDTSSSLHSLDSFNTSSSHSGGLESCSELCVLGATSPIAIVSPLLWLLGWIGVRSVSLETRNDNIAETSTHDYKPRLRSATASTVDLSDDDTDGDDVEYGNENDFQQSASELSCDSPRSEQDFDDESSDQSSNVHHETTSSETNNFGAARSGDDDVSSTEGEENVMREAPGTSSMDTNRFSKPKSTQWMRRFEYLCWIVISILEIFIVAVLLGSYFENERAALAPDTSYNFITEVVCAFDEFGVFQTFDTPHQADIAGYTVAHCGTCGECSNPSDIARYVETRTTVAKQSKKCSLEAIFGSDEDLELCLEREIGFTRSCTTCWAENMKNTAKHCLWTCLSNMFTGLASNNTVEGARDYDWLNQCVFCDEKQSGPAFVQCSGVARRRLGIPSEFQRDPAELCPLVEVDYLSTSWRKSFIAT